MERNDKASTTGTRFKDIRLQLGYNTQEEFGIALGKVANKTHNPIGRTIINRYENDSLGVSQKVKRALFAHFKVNLEWLEDEIGNPFIRENKKHLIDVIDDANLNGNGIYKDEMPPDYAAMLHEYIIATKIRAEAEKIDALARLEQSKAISMLVEKVTASLNAIPGEFDAIDANLGALKEFCLRQFAEIRGKDLEALRGEYGNAVAFAYDQAVEADRSE